MGVITHTVRRPSTPCPACRTGSAAPPVPRVPPVVRSLPPWCHAAPSCGRDPFTNPHTASRMAGDLLLRFLIGGLVISAFALVGHVVRPKTFAGLFGAAPSVALATLALAFRDQAVAYVATEGRSMGASDSRCSRSSCGRRAHRSRPGSSWWPRPGHGSRFPCSPGGSTRRSGRSGRGDHGRRTTSYGPRPAASLTSVRSRSYLPAPLSRHHP